jgi:hypothetical protein
MKTAIDPFSINTTTRPAPSGFAVRTRMRAKRLLKANGHVAGLVRVMEGEKPRNPDDVYLRESIRLAQGMPLPSNLFIGCTADVSTAFACAW